jgi:hypothetical protein
MSYLAQLLAGYRRGLTDVELTPLDDLEAALAAADDPEQRGRMLGCLARTLALCDGHATKIDQLRQLE